MKLKINGEEKNVNAGNPTIAELLEIEKVETPDYVSVQLNGVFAEKKNFSVLKVAENDEVDFLYFMGGGL